MVAYGLSGNPPEEIAEELREAWRELLTSFIQKVA
jgi:galactose-1-phosphate uridylyltransferase